MGYTTKNSALPHDTASALVATPDGLWVGTLGGLAHFYQGRWQSYTTQNSALPDDGVSALAATPDGLWVGTFRGGLAHFHQGQWQSYTTKNSALPDDRVRALEATPDGLWVGTESGLAHFRQGPPPEIADFIGRPEKDRITQSRHTFAVIPFDPTYQTTLDRFHYYWVLTRHTLLHTVTHDESTTHTPAKTFTFTEQEDGHYTVTVTAIDTHGVRSTPFSYDFEVALPGPPPPLLVWLKRSMLSGGVLSLLYLSALFPLVHLYARRGWARTAINSGVFSKFPLLHKSILNSAWARRHLFARVATFSTRVEVPQHYIPQAVYGPGLLTTDPLHLDGSRASLADLFQAERQGQRGHPRVLLLGRSGAGKSVLLRFLLRVTAQRFLDGEEHNLPLLLDLRTAPFEAKGGIEALLRGALQGAGIELSTAVLDFLIQKGHFLILLDSLNEVPDITVLKDALNAFLHRDAHNWILVASQLDLLERQDMRVYSLQEVTEEKARTYLCQVTGADLWDHLPPEAQTLARNPQDLTLLGEMLRDQRPDALPTRRADLYRELLQHDQPLEQWVQWNSGEIRAIYGLAFRMIEEGRRVLAQDDELAAWVRPQLEAYHLQGNATVRAVVEAIQRSHMFIQEDEQNLLGRSRSMIGFRHELIGKYLAACHLLPLAASSRGEAPAELVTLSQDPRWFDVLCFVLDGLQAPPPLHPLLKAFLHRGRPTQLRLVAYALNTKPTYVIDDDIRQAYLSAKVHADLY